MFGEGKGDRGKGFEKERVVWYDMFEKVGEN